MGSLARYQAGPGKIPYSLISPTIQGRIEGGAIGLVCTSLSILTEHFYLILLHSVIPLPCIFVSFKTLSILPNRHHIIPSHSHPQKKEGYIKYTPQNLCRRLPSCTRSFHHNDTFFAYFPYIYAHCSTAGT